MKEKFYVEECDRGGLCMAMSERWDIYSYERQMG